MEDIVLGKKGSFASKNKEFKKWQWGCHELHGLKYEVIFYLRILQYPKFNQFVSLCQSYLNMEHSIKLKQKFKKLAIAVHFLQTTQRFVISRCCFAKDAKKFTMHMHSHCSAHQNLLFSDFPIAVAEVVFLNSLTSLTGQLSRHQLGIYF